MKQGPVETFFQGDAGEEWKSKSQEPRAKRATLYGPAGPSLEASAWIEGQRLERVRFRAGVAEMKSL